MSTIPSNIRSANFLDTWNAETQYSAQMKFGGVNNAPLFYASPIVEDLGVWWICKGPDVPVLGVHPASDEAWTKFSITTGDGTGTVTSTSVVTANGMAGTVATATTTPAITLTTTVTGIIKGNGTAFSAALAGTDYLAPGVTVAQGGTGQTTLSAYAILAGGTTGTGAMQQVSGLGTSGQVLTSNGAGQLPTWETVTASSATNLAGGAANQVVYQTGAGTTGFLAASAGALTYTGSALAYQTIASDNTASAIVTRDGSGNFVAGTITATLTGNASTATALATPRAIYGNNFDGSADLTQVIAATYGGTGNAFTQFGGAATSIKTYTLPNASCNVLTDNAAVTVAQGGTGLQTATTAYGVVCAGTTATGEFQVLNSLGTAGQSLMSNGAAALPSFQDLYTNPTWTITDASGAGLTFTDVYSSVTKIGKWVCYTATLTYPTTADSSTASLGGMLAANVASGATWTGVASLPLGTEVIQPSIFSGHVALSFSLAKDYTTNVTNADLSGKAIFVTISYLSN